MEKKDSEAEALAFGISHQIRNPVAIIRSLAESCLLNSSLSENNYKALESILRCTEDIEKKLETLADFSKPVQLKVKKVSLQDLIQRAVFLIQEKVKFQNVVLKMETHSSPPEVLVDGEKLIFALLQILVNALEAMPEGGALTIEVDWNLSEKVYTISIADTGEGIPVERLDEMMRPFFTTKSESLGLGLAIARKILQAHGGKLSIASEAGRGTTVTIQLPI